jgi:hypothetical protein
LHKVKILVIKQEMGTVQATEDNINNSFIAAAEFHITQFIFLVNLV